MSKSIKRFFSNSVIFALASIVLGVLMLIMGAGLLNLLVKVLAIVIIAYGVLEIVRYFSGKGRKSTTDLCIGIIAVVAGVLVLIFPQMIVDLFPIIIGVLLVLEGLTDLAAALRGRSKNKLVNIIIGAVVILAGLFLIFRAGMVMDIVVIVAGIVLIVNGFSILFLGK